MQSTAIIHRCRPFTAASLLSTGINPFLFHQKAPSQMDVASLCYKWMVWLGWNSGRQGEVYMEHLTVRIKHSFRWLFSTQVSPVLPPHLLPTNFYRLWVTLLCYPPCGHLPLWVYLLKWNGLVVDVCDKHFKTLHFRTSNLLSVSISCLLSQRGGCPR